MAITSVASTSNILQPSAPVQNYNNTATASQTQGKRQARRSTGLTSAIQQTFAELGVSYSSKTFRQWQGASAGTTEHPEIKSNPNGSLQGFISELYDGLTRARPWQQQSSTYRAPSSGNGSNPITNVFPNISSELESMAQAAREGRQLAQKGDAINLQQNLQKFIGVIGTITGKEMPEVELADFLDKLAANIKGSQTDSLASGNFISTAA